MRCFDLPTGKMMDLGDEKRAEIVGMVREEAEKWVESENAGSRIRGITLLGGLRLQTRCPSPRKLFQDKTPTGTVSRGEHPVAEAYGVQEAAALALVRLIGRDAIPIIEQERRTANWYMKEKLTEVLEGASREK